MKHDGKCVEHCPPKFEKTTDGRCEPTDDCPKCEKMFGCWTMASKSRTDLKVDLKL